MTTRILVIDDLYATQADLRGSLCQELNLVKANFETSDSELESLVKEEDAIAGAVFSSGQERHGSVVENSVEAAVQAVKRGWPSEQGWRWGLILLDIEFVSTPPREGNQIFGLKVLEEFVRRWPDKESEVGNSELPVVMLSSRLRSERARQANRAGARAYVEKSELNRERLRELLDEHGLIADASGKLIGRSYALLKVLREARRIARMKSGNALILGAQGVGKSTLAHYIHAHSKRSGEFVPFFSTPSAEQLEYSALFGYWYGAHSTATESTCGKVEEAHEGTLLIDEVHNLKRDTQQELLQVGRLERGHRCLRRLGNFPTSLPRRAEATRSVRGRRDPLTSLIEVDVLLLTATNEPLDDLNWRLSHGFSDPLYTRLALEYARKPLQFPDLAQRCEDIPMLFDFFLRQETENINGRTDTDGMKVIDPEVKRQLTEYKWPGNVAEMKGVAMEVALNSRDFPDVFPRHLPSLGEPRRSITPAPTSSPSPAYTPNNLEEVERALRNVQVPRSLDELEGRLGAIHKVYGQLVKEMLEVALAQMKLSRGPRLRKKDKVCLPTMRLLFGDEIVDTSTAYSTLLKLSKVFEDDPPAPGSCLEAALRLARRNRNPRSKNPKKDS